MSTRPGGCELWLADLAASADALAEMEARTPRLGPAELARAAAFSDAAVRREWLAAHIALRLLLERVAGPQVRGVDYALAPGGKPSLPALDLGFSLSHARGRALIGIHRSASIGVDVERPRHVRVDAQRWALIEAAAVALAGAALPGEGEARFLQAWVRLEAFAKADGCGVGRLLTRLGILGGRRRAIEEAVAALQDEAGSDAIVVRDIAAGAETFAAVAAPAAGPLWAPALVHLPAGTGDLQRLLA